MSARILFSTAARILTETDSPYLPPQKLRGKSNVPANVHAVVDCLAETRGGDSRTRVKSASTRQYHADEFLLCGLGLIG